MIFPPARSRMREVAYSFDINILSNLKEPNELKLGIYERSINP